MPLLSDNSYVLCQDGENFVLSGFGFAVPAGQTIAGIRVEIEHRTFDDNGDDSACVDLSWNGGVSYDSEQKCAITNADGADPDEVDIVGSTNDAWGHVWSAAEINGLYLRVVADTQGGSQMNSVDRIRVAVEYVPVPPTPTVTVTAVDTATPTETPVPAATATITPTPVKSGFLPANAFSAGSPTCDSTGNALLSDNSYVLCQDGENFVLSGFGLGVPTGSTIDGIRVEIEHRTSLDWFTDETCITLSWDGGATFPSNEDCANTNADGAEADDFDIVGAVNDTWGHTWTVAEINDVYVRAEAASGASTMSIDQIRVWVAYTLPSGTPTDTPTATDTPVGTPMDTPVASATPTSTPTQFNVDGFDAVLVLQLDAGLVDALPCAEGADANGDGRVNCLDATVLLQLIAGLLDSLSQ